MSQLFTFDFTGWTDVETTKEWCKENCKKWVFQLEECPTTLRLHCQGRVSLKEKTRESTLKKRCPPWLHVSATSNNNKDNEFYVTKVATRKGGPWTDRDIEVPWDVAEIRVMKPWQNSILELLQDKRNIRKIDIVIDTVGGIGKTTLVRFLGVYKMAMQIPFINDNKDLMRMVMDMPKMGAYTVDMPRALKKDKLIGIYSAIETVKGGYAYDDRYSFKYEYFAPPNVVVFTNQVPELKYYTADRWRLWYVDRETEELKVFVPPKDDD